ncbi:MAG: universal stress protein [Gemmatimonadetes bacterium]|nr:universal stress protein [Gemmatimonadota bacterium]
MFRRILVPLDGTAFGDHALPYAIAIATRTGATLELAHVHRRVETEPQLSGMPQYQFEHVEEIRAGDDDDALAAEDAMLEERASGIEQRYGVRAIARVLRGSMVKALTDEAADTVADMVVMSTHARSGLLRLRHGDLAADLVRNLNIPTLCVQPPDDAAQAVGSGALRRILVTLDGSDFSEQILDFVVPLANALGARLSLLHVISPASMMITAESDLQRPIPHRTEAMEYLTHVAAKFPAGTPEPELIAAEAGDGASAIIAELQRPTHDALAIATHGRSGLSRMILGSVAERVVRATKRPVLLYRPRIVRIPESGLTDAFRIYGD